MRTICWYSHGVPSAVATKIVLAQEIDTEVVVVNIDTGSEHPDNERFQADCEKWFGASVHVLKSQGFADTWEVYEKTRYLVGPTGARCTTELKKRVRFAFEQPDDVHVFGYTADIKDATRATRFSRQNPGVSVRYPLIEANLTKAECLTLVERAGIELPAMYRLGYTNNNCIGCVKGGMGYWNKIRQDFPEVFERMVAVEKELNHTILRDNGAPLFLGDLGPFRGNYKAEPPADCSLNCQAVENDIEVGAA